MREFAARLQERTETLPASTYALLADANEWTIIALDCMKAMTSWSETDRQEAAELLDDGEFGRRFSDYARTRIDTIRVSAGAA